MKFTLPRFGAEQVEIDPDSIITFPAGLPGFEACTRFKMFHEEGKASLFWLQSLDDPAVVFFLRDPALLNLTYEVTLTDDEETALQIAPGDELSLAVILFKDEPSGNIPGVRANMRAPIILNISKRLALQKVLCEFDAQVAIKGS